MLSFKTKFVVVSFFACASFVFAYGAHADTVTFNVDPAYHWQRRERVTATEQYTGLRARWYVSDQYWYGLGPRGRTTLFSDIQNLAGEFDGTIYPRLRDVFGSENTPGVDGDTKITILLTRIGEDAGGYLREQDSFLKEKVPTSNEREMINLNVLYIGKQRAKSFLAHEFQHLITLNQKMIRHGVPEEVWLNEFRSEIAATILGYDNLDVYEGSNLEARVKVFRRESSDAILDWENKIKDYASINLFGQYVLDHYGRSVIAHMIRTDKTGIESFNDALAFFGFSETFSDVYTNWTIASVVNDCSVEPVNTYCYKNPALRGFRVKFGPPDAAGKIIASKEATRDWRADWNRFEAFLKPERPADHVFRLDFNAPATSNFRVPYVVYDRDGLVKDVKEIMLKDGDGVFFVEDFGFLISEVVIIPSNQSQLKGTQGNAPHVIFLMTATTVPAVSVDYVDEQNVSEVSERTALSMAPVAIIEQATQLPDLPDGSLIRAEGDYKVYITKGPYKRWIQSAEIFEFYGHLNFAVVNVLPKETVALYKDAWLVRAAGDSKVYEINGDGTRHWLDISAAEFSASGRLWDMVSVINSAEIAWYKEGASVK